MLIIVCVSFAGTVYQKAVMCTVSPSGYARARIGTPVLVLALRRALP
ncbi:hypothetical protein Z945_2129 [Sulfitobacter noctilucae]|nr:hypothetical protein Z945_2129 [Sulfitobacter noctilucae]